MKRILLTLLFSFFTVVLSAQTTVTIWQWAVSSNRLYPRAAASDATGNIFVTGYFYGTVTIGAHTISSGYRDVYLAKYNSSGTLQWLKSAAFGTTYAQDYGAGVGVDGSGNVYIAGTFQDSVKIGTQTLYASHGICWAKFSSNGTLIWAKSANSSFNSSSVPIFIPHSLTVDVNNNLYLLGNCKNLTSASFGSVTLSPTARDIFLVKIDSSGTAVWGQTASVGSPTLSAISPGSIAVDAAGGVYVSGSYFGNTLGNTISFGNTTLTHASSGSFNGFVAKYSSTGSFRWAHSLPDPQESRSNGIAVDKNCNLYLVGTHNATTTIAGSLLSTAGGFLAKYDSAGTGLWAVPIGQDSVTSPTSITMDVNDNPFIAGVFSTLSLPIGTYNLTNSGHSDLFYAIFSASGAPLWATRVGGTWSESGSAITDKAGYIVTFGSFLSPSLPFGSINLNPISPSTYTAYLAKIDAPCSMEVFDTPSIIANGDTLTVTPTFSFYQWYRNGLPIPGATGQTYKATQGGNYFVRVTNSSYCQALSNTIALATSISDPNTLATISVSPNPASTEISVKANTRIGKIEIMDNFGRVVANYLVESSETKLQLGNLANGIYFLKSEHNSKVIRIVKQ
ncbi:MAG TPA: SBBP repeat-containing protein [Flavipsychrobacter sp.]|nr:SBBP repeat-containing protein [Flavipsychrobacter sp.]